MLVKDHIISANTIQAWNSRDTKKSKEESRLYHSKPRIERLYCTQIQLLLSNQHAAECRYKLVYTRIIYAYGE